MSFKLNYDNFYKFYKEDINSYFTSKFENKLANELKMLIITYCNNFQQIQDF